MKTQHVLILIAVAVLMLFGISIALGVRQDRNASLGADKSWAQTLAEKLAPEARLSPEEIEAPDCLQDGRFVFSKNLGACTARIQPSKRAVRKVTLTLKGSDDFRLQYEPDPQDKNAVPVNVSRFAPNDSVDLAIMEHGGKLTLTRLTSKGAATVQMD